MHCIVLYSSIYIEPLKHWLRGDGRPC